MSSSAAARERERQSFKNSRFTRYTTRRARGLCRRGLGGRSMGAIGSDAKGSSRRLSFAVDGRPRHSRISRARLADCARSIPSSPIAWRRTAHSNSTRRSPIVRWDGRVRPNSWRRLRQDVGSRAQGRCRPSEYTPSVSWKSKKPRTALRCEDDPAPRPRASSCAIDARHVPPRRVHGSRLHASATLERRRAWRRPSLARHARACSRRRAS